MFGKLPPPACPGLCYAFTYTYMHAYIHTYIAEPLVGLKRLASFGARGGGVVVHDFSRLVQTWCRGGSGPFLCISWSVHGNKKMVLEIIFFGAGNQFFGAGNQFFGENLVLEIHFWGFGNLDEISGRFS